VFENNVKPMAQKEEAVYGISKADLETKIVLKCCGEDWRRHI